MLQIHHGRPDDCSQRMPREVRVYDLLDSLGVEYDRLDHDKADTMEVCEAINAAFGRITLQQYQNEDSDEKRQHAIICKNLFLRNKQGTAYYLLLMPGDKKFLTRLLSAQINSARLSFAGPDDMLEMLDLLPGSVSVLGLMNDHDNRVRLLIDEDVLKSEYIGCHPCANTSSLRMRTADMMQKVIPALNHTPTIVNLNEEE